jgi:hypothetical protein
MFFDQYGQNKPKKYGKISPKYMKNEGPKLKKKKPKAHF